MRILKWSVPVDDQWHEIHARPEDVRLSDCYGPAVWFWAAETSATARYRIFGTGHPIPDGARHVSTSIDGLLVWHLVAMPGGEPT